MVPMYKKGGKKPKSKNSFMEESKEIKFGDKPIMKGYGGMMKYKKGGMPDLTGDGKVTFADVLKGRGVDEKQTGGPKAKTAAPAEKQVTGKTGYMVPVGKGKVFTEDEKKKALESFKKSAEDKISGKKVSEVMKTYTNKKKTGGKSMEPGGGGRFAAMVSKLKGKGKSEESAKAIAASIGRKKYGKSKFQEMAAKGKKGLGGMSDSTSANEAGMEMMEAMGPKKPKGSSGSKHTGPNAKRAKRAQRKVQSGRGGCNRGEICFD